MVFRVYVERRENFRQESETLRHRLEENLQLSFPGGIRILHRYDVEGISEEEFFKSIPLVFCDAAKDQATVAEMGLWKSTDSIIPIEALPGQFDQRADSAAQCIQFVLGGKSPKVRYATIYIFRDDLSEEEQALIEKELINPVENRIASFDVPKSLEEAVNEPDDVEILTDFADVNASDWVEKLGLAMDADDVKMCQDYFKSENRNPSIAEIKVIDTYWSDHCRHTTFNTELEEIVFNDNLAEATYNQYLKARKELNRTKPITLMDLGTLAAKELKKLGLLSQLDESEEINACTVKVKIKIEETGELEDWLLLFKNETHNHPTEIEPFGGAATCLGGAIRDPLSGRAYVYQAMRITGAADPFTKKEDTPEGKLLQRQIITRACEGYSSYGNQVGLTTGYVEEIYHPGYIAKRMECGAVIGAVPEANVVREEPAPGDLVLLLGGKTGRDGIGGATGSSKSHTVESVEVSAAEVQKGNAPEERGIMRLFRHHEFSKNIKRCNDFGAGGVSVAIGELADGVLINLDKVPKKYEGLDGTELAISESQERMAIVIAKENLDLMMKMANSENVSCTVVAEITEDPRMVMNWRGKKIVNLSREFLDTNGAAKSVKANVKAPRNAEYKYGWTGDLEDSFKVLLADLNVASQEGLLQRFDQTVGARTILHPLGGKYQKTTPQAMAARLPRLHGGTDSTSVMSFGYNPYLTEKDEYSGAYLAVLESAAKIIATGGHMKECWLTFQEYFQKLGNDADKWGSPLAAVLGAYQAQMDLGLASIGGKDSMSGSYEDLHVPPTFLSFAVSMTEGKNVISPEFKKIGSKVLITEYKKSSSERNKRFLPEKDEILALFEWMENKISDKKVISCATPVSGGSAEILAKMMFGNKIGLNIFDDFDVNDLFKWNYGGFVFECDDSVSEDDIKAWKDELAGKRIVLKMLGETVEESVLQYKEASVELDVLIEAWEATLRPIFPVKEQGIEVTELKDEWKELPKVDEVGDKYKGVSILPKGVLKPKVVIPVFPGTNCEEESAEAFIRAGADVDIIIIRNRTEKDISDSRQDMLKAISNAQILFLPGGFSGGDEPDGSGKFINAFLRGEEIAEAINDLLEKRNGLVGGICNGFQALVKLGLLPYGKITDTDHSAPILTNNFIGRHQAKMVHVRIATNRSPWLQYETPGDIQHVVISHGEGRFAFSEKGVDELFAKGQIASQYVDLNGNPTMETEFTPNGSIAAIEALISEDGKVFGRMGHSERMIPGTLKNLETGLGNEKIFKGAVDYFKRG